MADNFTQATVTPDLPASLFAASELESLAEACGIRHEQYGENLYFFADAWFAVNGEDLNGAALNCLMMFQEKLGQLDDTEYPFIAIEGASTCSKMRPGEFGGFVYLITRNRLASFSTWEWLSKQRNRLARKAA